MGEIVKLRLPVLILTLAAAVLSAVSPPTRAGDCSGVTCEIVSITPGTVALGDDVNVVLAVTIPAGCSAYGQFEWGDGGVDPLSNLPGHIYQHQYYSAGDMPARVVVYNQSQQVLCQKTATIAVMPCSVSPCSVSVDHINYPSNGGAEVYFTVAGYSIYCGSFYSPWVQYTPWPGASLQTLHLNHPGPFTFLVYYTPEHFGSFAVPFTFGAYHGWQGIPDVATCAATCQVSVTLPQPCLTVGSLKFCADTITPPAPQGNATYTLQGNASVNGIMFATQECTFTGDPASGVGTFATRGDVFMKRPAGNKTLFTGPDLAFQVNGTDGVLQMDDAHISANPYYTYAPNGLTLRNTEGWLNFTNGLSFPATLVIGRAGRMPLGSLRTVFRVPTSGPVTLGATMVVEGALQPGFVVTGASLTYDEAAGAEGTLGGTVDLNLPDLGTWQVRGDLAVENGCINKIHVPPFQVKDLVFGNMGYQFQNSLEITLSDICDPLVFQTKFSSTLVGKAGVTTEQFSISDADLVFVPPSAFIILDGKMNFACETLTDLDGEILSINAGGPPFEFHGSMKAFWWDGEWRVKGVVGEGKGDFHIDLDYCRGDIAGSLAKCHAGLTLVKLLGADPPLVVPHTKLLLGFDSIRSSFSAVSELKLTYGHVFAAVYIAKDCSEVHSGLGGTWEALARVMRVRGESAGVFTVPGGLERASFAAVGASAVPAVTLQTPTGGTITPENAASFPGVLYRGDSDTLVALFTVLSPEAGTWTLTSNLAPPDATLLTSLEAYDPSVAVTSVSRTGEQVSVSGSVIPGSAATLVDVVCASSPGGLAEGTIASGLPVPSGTISTVWDTSLVSTGTYYIGLSASFSGGYPVEAWSSVPVVVNHGGPAPPTDLTGTRAGNSVVLTWTPSAIPNVTGYFVKYTAAPSVPGYTSWDAAASSQGTTVSGLDPSKNYRFAAVAVDATGATSLESASFMTASCAPACAASAPGSVQTGQPAAFAAHASSEHCSGAVAYDWNFGDGSAHSTQESPAHAFAAPGSYTWTLTVSSGGVSSTCTGLTYAVATPVCSLTCSTSAPSTGKAGQPVAFASSVQKPGCVMPERVTWNFGDGTVSADAAPSHAYAAPGAYAWSFTVNSDGFACSEGGTVEISVATPGDCDGNGTVSIGEVQRAINMFLGTQAPGCGVDCYEDGTVSIGEVQKVINGFLGLAVFC